MQGGGRNQRAQILLGTEKKKTHSGSQVINKQTKIKKNKIFSDGIATTPNIGL